MPLAFMLFRLAGLSDLLCLPAVGFLRAQAPVNLPSETFKQQLRSHFLHNDTAPAIINLYSKRQAGGVGWMVGGGLAGGRLATSGSRELTSGPGYAVYEEAPAAGTVLLVTLPFLGYGLGKLLRYSNGNLGQILTAYRAGQGLPRSLRRKLKPRFFAQPIIEYTPVPVTPARKTLRVFCPATAVGLAGRQPHLVGPNACRFPIGCCPRCHRRRARGPRFGRGAAVQRLVPAALSGPGGRGRYHGRAAEPVS